MLLDKCSAGRVRAVHGIRQGEMLAKRK